MAAKRKSKRPRLLKFEIPEDPDQELSDIMDGLGHAISLVCVAKCCLGYQSIAGDEYATLQTAINQLLDCHKRLDLIAAFKEEQKDEKG